MYLCRGADPESKGKIESVVKYVKGNFLEHRIYVDDEILNSSLLDWLARTANAQVHGTSKRIPAEVFQEEREYLQPLVSIPENREAYLCRTVRKDNTIVYDSNRYSVPLGTYTTNPEVNVEVRDGTLYIQTIFGEAICEHRICTGKGMLIQNNNHLRDRTSSLDRMQAALDELLAGQAGEFLQAIRNRKAKPGHQIGELGGVIRVMLTEVGIKWIEVNPSLVKKFATGRGNAKKEEIAIAIYKRWGREFLSNDEADAFVLAVIGQALVGLSLR